MTVGQKGLAADNTTLVLRIYSPAFNDTCVVEECVQGAVLPEQAVPQMSTAAFLAARGRALLVTLVRLTAQEAEQNANGDIRS